jgi:oligopeptidase B
MSRLDAERDSFRRVADEFAPLAAEIEWRRSEMMVPHSRTPIELATNRQHFDLKAVGAKSDGVEIWTRRSSKAAWKSKTIEFGPWLQDQPDATVVFSWALRWSDVVILHVDPDGTEQLQIQLRDSRTGELLDQIDGTGNGFDYENETCRLAYTKNDSRGRSTEARVRTYTRDLRTVVSDVSLYQETDPSRNVVVVLQELGPYFTITSTSWQQDEWFAARADEEQLGPLLPMLPPLPDHYRDVVYHPNYRRFLVATIGPGGSRVTLESAPDDDPLPPDEIYRDTPRNPLYAIDWARSHLIVFERRGGVDALRSVKIRGGDQVALQLPRNRAISSPYIEGDRRSYGVNTDGYTDYGATYSFDLSTQVRHQMLRTTARTVRAKDIRHQRSWVTSTDSTKVPVDVLHHATASGTEAPCVLYVYGGYGNPTDPWFNRLRLCVLERGFAWAAAHPRGGGEFGKRWHEAGTRSNVQRCVDDVIATAKHLIDSGVTTPESLVIQGASFGGGLAAAAANQAPHLFRMVIAEMPQVDLLTELTTTRSPFAQHFASEFLRSESDHVAVSRYSPVDNVKAQPYPLIVLTTGLRDIRVPPEGVLAFADKVRALSTSGNPVLVDVSDGGHLTPDGDQAARIAALMIQAMTDQGLDHIRSVAAQAPAISRVDDLTLGD